MFQFLRKNKQDPAQFQDLLQLSRKRLGDVIVRTSRTLDDFIVFGAADLFAVDPEHFVELLATTPPTEQLMAIQNLYSYFQPGSHELLREWSRGLSDVLPSPLAYGCRFCTDEGNILQIIEEILDRTGSWYQGAADAVGEAISMRPELLSDIISEVPKQTLIEILPLIAEITSVFSVVHELPESVELFFRYRYRNGDIETELALNDLHYILTTIESPEDLEVMKRYCLPTVVRHVAKNFEPSIMDSVNEQYSKEIKKICSLCTDEPEPILVGLYAQCNNLPTADAKHALQRYVHSSDDLQAFSRNVSEDNLEAARITLFNAKRLTRTKIFSWCRQSIREKTSLSETLDSFESSLDGTYDEKKKILKNAIPSLTFLCLENADPFELVNQLYQASSSSFFKLRINLADISPEMALQRLNTLASSTKEKHATPLACYLFLKGIDKALAIDPSAGKKLIKQALDEIKDETKSNFGKIEAHLLQLYGELEPSAIADLIEKSHYASRLPYNYLVRGIYDPLVSQQEPIGNRQIQSLTLEQGLRWLPTELGRETVFAEHLKKMCALYAKMQHGALEHHASLLNEIYLIAPHIKQLEKYLKKKAGSGIEMSTVITMLQARQLIRLQRLSDANNDASTQHTLNLLARFALPPETELVVRRSIEPSEPEALKSNFFNIVAPLIRADIKNSQGWPLGTNPSGGRNNEGPSQDTDSESNRSKQVNQTGQLSDDSQNESAGSENLSTLQLPSLADLQKQFLEKTPSDSLLHQSAPSLGLGGNTLPPHQSLGFIRNQEHFLNKFLIQAIYDKLDRTSSYLLPVSDSRYSRLLSRSKEAAGQKKNDIEVQFQNVLPNSLIPGMVRGSTHIIANGERWMPSVLKRISLSPDGFLVLGNKALPDQALNIEYNIGGRKTRLQGVAPASLVKMLPKELRHLTAPWSKLAWFPSSAQAIVEVARNESTALKAVKTILKFVRSSYQYDLSAPHSSRYEDFVAGIPHHGGTLKARLDLIHSFGTDTVLGAGVCAEFSWVARELLAHAGIPAGITEGIRLLAQELTQKMAHATPYVLLPNLQKQLTFVIADPLFMDLNVAEVTKSTSLKFERAPAVAANTSVTDSMDPEGRTSKWGDYFSNMLQALDIPVPAYEIGIEVCNFIEDMAAIIAQRKPEIFSASLTARLANVWSLLNDPSVRNLSLANAATLTKSALTLFIKIAASAADENHTAVSPKLFDKI